MVETIPTKSSKIPIMYAIQRKSDGLWSRGGCGPSWGKFPKTWGTGPFKNHLNMFKADAWAFNAAKWKSDLKLRAYTSYHNPEKFTKYKLLSHIFPYSDCEVVVFNSNTLEVVERFPAEQWAWHQCYYPSYLNNDERYVPNIKEFAETFGLEFD